MIDPLDVALTITRILEHLGVPCTVGGSIAASFAGEPRASIDIDVIAALEEQHVQPFVAALGADFYADEDALRRAVRQKSRTNLVHQPTQLKVDLFVAGGTPLDEQQLRRHWWPAPARARDSSTRRAPRTAVLQIEILFAQKFVAKFTHGDLHSVGRKGGRLRPRGDKTVCLEKRKRGDLA